MRLAVFCFLLAGFSVEAGEILRLTADLDGDRKPELVTLSISGGKAEYKKFSLRVGNASHDGDYFAADGDVPQLALVRVDRNKLPHQLLVTTAAPDYCSYELLAFQKGKLKSLMKHGSKSCVAPRALGDGRLEVLTWEGFWNRRDYFLADASGARMVLERRTVYRVEVSGVAARAIALVPERCREATIAAGNPLLVKSYEPARNRYLLMDHEGACGWIGEVEFTGAVRDLPARIGVNLP
jgi:hypothetical protein